MSRWEAEEPGRAARAALLWTQLQAEKVANSVGIPATPTPTPGIIAAAGDDQKIGQGVDGQEEWIKARAAAIKVPVKLEKEREEW